MKQLMGANIFFLQRLITNICFKYIKTHEIFYTNYKF